MNYVALGCLAEFDDYFASIYAKGILSHFCGDEIEYETENFRKFKYIIKDEKLAEEKSEKLKKQIF